MLGQYAWPYSISAVFTVIFAVSLITQVIIKLKIAIRKLRILLPLIAFAILIVAFLSIFFVTPPPGVLLGEIEVMFVIAVPGIAILSGVILGELIVFLWKQLF